MKVLLVLIFLFPVSGFSANAGAFAEPYAGYFTGEAEGTDTTNADVKSFVAGARLGYRTEGGWAFGIDYAQGKGDYDTSSESFDYTTKDGGFFVGYYFPAYVKVWASYIIQYEEIIEGFPTTGTDRESEGDGYNVGIGIRGIPFVTVNLTYSERTIDEINGATNISGDNKIKTTLVSVSLPYNFPWKP